MYSKGVVIVAITKRGTETALRIKEALKKRNVHSNVFAKGKYNQQGVIPLDRRLDEFVKEIYYKTDAIVAVMAAGIIIRAVAPYLKNKLIDPAIVGVDATGCFVISLEWPHHICPVQREQPLC